VVLTLEGENLVPRAHKGDGFRISTAVRDRVVNQKTSILVKDAQKDDAFKSRLSIVEQKVHTMMAVPLQTKDRIIGLIYLDSPFVLREFTSDDLNLLTVMANVAASRLENARLAEIEQAERIMKRDLAQAADIQRKILPDKAPLIRGVDLAGYNMACRTVGGDYYGFFPYTDGRVSLALGDVSGKGMPAALLVMQLQARLEALAEEPSDLSALVTRLNKITCANCPSNRFITFFMSMLNPATGDLAFANAGHNPPIIVRASGEIELLEGGGPVLGILPIAKYAEQQARLGKGDLLVIYSDGVTEATDMAEDEYGEERLTEELRKRRGESADTIVTAVTESVSRFVAGAPQADDITLVVAKRT
jgi:serine phosphatase RsbU (regulator of sigma subunit)